MLLQEKQNMRKRWDREEGKKIEIIDTRIEKRKINQEKRKKIEKGKNISEI